MKLRPTSALLAAGLVSLLVIAPGCDTGAARPPTAATPPPAPAAPLEARRAALRQVIADQWEYTMRTQPEYATILGDKRYNDRWSDLSEKAVHANLDADRAFLARLQAIDEAGFPEQEVLDEALLARQLRLELDGERFEEWLMPVNQFSGPHIDIAQFVSMMPFDGVKDFDDYVTRLRTLPTVLDQTQSLMRAGAAKGLVPPRILLGKVASQAEAIAAPSLEESAFAVPVKKFPAAVPEADRARLRAAVLAAIRDQVNPAYKSFAAFVRADYEPHGRPEPGEWSLPLGPERYRYDIEQRTSTKMTADEIHRIGLSEVARIEGLMLGIARKMGYSDLRSFAAAIEKDPARHFRSRQEILDLYRRYTDQMEAKLPGLFGRLPKAKVIIMPVEEFREKDASGAQYNLGTPDGTRPGHVMVNTGAFDKRTNLVVETTAYHEGLPGHHLQMTIAQEVTGLPEFRQHYDVTAFIEGWALYSERLGEEVGFFQDPYSYYGHLQDEMLRAIRLVVDTGLHDKKWTRQQVVDFFHAHSTDDEVEVQSETDRYIAVPAQALGYKLGQLKILALREKAKAALGDRFDIRTFHDTVLDSGPLPLDVLESQVDRWVDATLRGAHTAAPPRAP
jgi:uncharacterized protein (DUF885 family)